MDESVVADEDAYMTDSVAAPGLEKHQVAGFEFAAFDLVADACHFDRGAGKFHAEDTVVHEPDEAGAVESSRCLPAEPVSDAEKLLDVAEKVLHGAGCFFSSGLQGYLFRRRRSEGVCRRGE